MISEDYKQWVSEHSGFRIQVSKILQNSGFTGFGCPPIDGSPLWTAMVSLCVSTVGDKQWVSTVVSTVVPPLWWGSWDYWYG